MTTLNERTLNYQYSYLELPAVNSAIAALNKISGITAHKEKSAGFGTGMAITIICNTVPTPDDILAIGALIGTTMAYRLSGRPAPDIPTSIERKEYWKNVENGTDNQ